LIPPTSTTIARIVITAPVIQVGIPKVPNTAPEMEFAWVIFPIPKEAITAKPENSTARTDPMVLFLKPFFMAYIGPPAISPSAFVSRYLTARTLSPYLVERPNKALIHIHTKAPGPPKTMAVATPTMLPVPMVAARAVIKDWNGEISPLDSFFAGSCLTKTDFNA
jgi:hypothetical protein